MERFREYFIKNGTDIFLVVEMSIFVFFMNQIAPFEMNPGGFIFSALLNIIMVVALKLSIDTIRHDVKKLQELQEHKAE